ncbi:MAG: hypothetical protein Q8755_03015, partial [Candidatus Phytoplasma australasiaticum]|nr:hypothetical protein [Candidatus Phytoplasma australasiaticum]
MLISDLQKQHLELNKRVIVLEKEKKALEAKVEKKGSKIARQNETLELHKGMFASLQHSLASLLKAERERYKSDEVQKKRDDGKEHSANLDIKPSSSQRDATGTSKAGPSSEAIP